MVRIRVGSRKSFEAMNRAILANGIHPVVDRVFPLEKLPEFLTNWVPGKTLAA